MAVSSPVKAIVAIWSYRMFRAAEPSEGNTLKIGIGTADLTIEEIPADRFAGSQRHRHIAAIIERQFHRFGKLSE
mgnify:FL=1